MAVLPVAIGNQGQAVTFGDAQRHQAGGKRVD